MSGEIPTEERALTEVTRSVAVARNSLLGEGSYAPDQGEVDFDLVQAYVAIGSLFRLRGQTDILDSAVQRAAEEAAEEARTRAELMEKFGIGSDTEAADIIINYWQGEKPDNLEASVRGFGDIELWRQASHFATVATSDDSEARQQFQNASDLLWRNYRGGHG